MIIETLKHTKLSKIWKKNIFFNSLYMCKNFEKCHLINEKIDYFYFYHILLLDIDKYLLKHYLIADQYIDQLRINRWK
jgi:hypothetical protein